MPTWPGFPGGAPFCTGLEEEQVAWLCLGKARHRRPDLGLVDRSPGHAHAELAEDVLHKTRAVETARRRAAPYVGDPEELRCLRLTMAEPEDAEAAPTLAVELVDVLASEAISGSTDVVVKPSPVDWESTDDIDAAVKSSPADWEVTADVDAAARSTANGSAGDGSPDDVDGPSSANYSLDLGDDRRHRDDRVNRHLPLPSLPPLPARWRNRRAPRRLRAVRRPAIRAVGARRGARARRRAVPRTASRRSGRDDACRFNGRPRPWPACPRGVRPPRRWR